MNPIILFLFAAAGDVPRDATPICPNAEVHRVERGGGAEAKRLDRLPAGETYLAVLHRENGCTKPILARQFRAEQGRR